MTTGRKLKKLVRERMARTGESYTAALRALKAARETEAPTSAPVDAVETDER